MTCCVIHENKKWIFCLTIRFVKILNIVCLLFLLICASIINNTRSLNFEPLYKKIHEFENYISEPFLYTFLVENEISKIKNYWKINEQNILIYNNYIRYNKRKEIPDISIIITVYNQANCFYKALRSVQNQKVENIEIIIVDDFSKDNSLEIIEKYQKEDNRIILLKHNYNYGKIKSRSDAVKLSKGKYITIIDGDDGLATRNILYNCLIIGKIGNLDVIEFKLAYFINKYFRRIETNLEPIENLNNRIIYQPELKYIFIRKKKNENQWSYINRNICSKLIKNEIFKKLIEFIGSKYTEDYISIFEDTIMSVSLFTLSNSYYIMKEPGYYRSKGECKETFTNINKVKCGLPENKINKRSDSLKYINFLFEKFNNSIIESNFIFDEVFTMDHNLILYKNSKEDFLYLSNLLELILRKFKFLNNFQKESIFALRNRILLKNKYSLKNNNSDIY